MNSSTPPFPQDLGVRNANPKLQDFGITSRTGCKFGRYIHRVHPNKSPFLR